LNKALDEPLTEENKTFVQEFIDKKYSGPLKQVRHTQPALLEVEGRGILYSSKNNILERRWKIIKKCDKIKRGKVKGKWKKSA
jgi:hypothetical protein